MLSPRRRILIPSLLLVAVVAASCLGLHCTPSTRKNHLRIPYEGRPEYAPPSLTLAEKAERFHALLEADHIAPCGLMIYRRPFPLDEKTRQSYSSFADTPIWGGVHLAAESFRYAATRDPDALAAVRRSVDALHLLQAVPGVPGLLARHIAPKSDPVHSSPQTDTSRWHAGTGDYADWMWRDDVSKDQYSGLIFGYKAAYDLVDDEAVRTRVRGDMTAIAEFLMKNKYRIIDHDGQPTTYGGLRARVGPIPVGVNALISLAAIKVAHHVSGESRFEKEYERLVRRRWPQATRLAKIQLFGKTNPNNDNMAFLSYYSLLSLEGVPSIRRHYEASLRRTWAYVRHEGNSFWTFLFLASGFQDAASLDDAVLQLRLFPATKRSYGVDVRGRKDIEHAFFTNRKGIPQAKYPLPINLRTQTAFAWRDCPYALYSALGAKGNLQYAPVDYLVAYWMARYSGVIKPED